MRSTMLAFQKFLEIRDEEVGKVSGVRGACFGLDRQEGFIERSPGKSDNISFERHSGSSLKRSYRGAGWEAEESTGSLNQESERGEESPR